MDFIGRDDELAFLEEQYRRDHPFVLVMGRRRVGKSRLILEFLKDKEHLYYETDRVTSEHILARFSSAVSDATGRRLGRFTEWEDALSAYVELGPPGRKVIVIDEFQYITMEDRGFERILQGIWDNYLSGKDVMLILCGSYLHMMRGIAEDSGNPLFGRNTGTLMLRPLRFADTRRGGDYRRAVEEYAITGGVPHYMMLMDPDVGPIRNAERLLMDTGAPLMDEPAFLMSDEFRDPASYNTYVRAIATGNRKADRIYSAVEEPASSVLPYLKRLSDAGIVERDVPVTETSENSRNGMFRISDNFISLWFQFVFPFWNRIQRGDCDEARANLESHFVDSHVSFVFEDVCREELRTELRSRGVAASYGSYWDRNVGIDVVAVDRANRTMYAGECKYRNTPVDAKVLHDLRSKCDGVRDFRGMDVVLCLFSVSGYTEGVLTEADAGNVLLFDCGKPIPGGS